MQGGMKGKMIKGCQKKIIYLKNTDSGIFDEAYFVLRRDGDADRFGEADMVSEAKRIIEGASIERACGKRKTHVWFFSMGALAATVFFAIIGVLIFLL